VNPILAEAAPLAEPFERILSALQDNRRSHVVLAVTDDETVRQEVTAALGEHLSGLYSFAEYDFADAPVASLPRYYRSLTKKAPVCVVARGLEILREREPARYKEALHFLNAHREDVRLAPGAVVLWTTTATFADVQEQAPDFADWENAVARFELPEGTRVERTALGRLALGEAEDQRRQIRRIEEMLKRPSLDRAMARELEKQLDLAERRLGYKIDLRRDYCLYLIDELREHVLRGFAPQVGGRVLSLPLREIFLPLQAVEGRPAVAEYAEEDLRRQAEREIEGELDWLRRRDEMEKRLAQMKARQAAQRPLELAELLDARRALLLGDPGSGKTTVTRYVAWALAADDPTHIGEGPRGRLPVLVRLANYGRALERARGEGGDLEVVDYVEHELLPRPELAEMLAKAIRANECLIILDGLDEVSDPNLRINVTRKIQALVARFSENRYLVTSRIVGYDRSPLTRDFTHATLKELESEDQKRFVRLWYRAIRSRTAVTSEIASEDALVNTLTERPQIARMAANPLLLTIMVLMHWRGVKLPSRRVQVYQIATDTLIEYWTTKRLESATPIDLDAEEIKRILAPIAHHILLRAVSGVIVREDLLPLFFGSIAEQRGCDPREAQGVGRRLLTILGEQSGLFLERGMSRDGQPVYGFLHQTFGEYLAALKLADEVMRGSFRLSEYINLSLWSEPLLLLIAHLSLFSPAHVNKVLRDILDFPSPFEEILHRNLLLATACLAEDIQVEPDLRKELLKRLALLLTQPATQLRQAALERFAELAATRHRELAAGAIDEQLQILRDPNAIPHESQLTLATALVRLGKPAAALPLLGLLQSTSFKRADVLRLRLQGWPDQAMEFFLEEQEKERLVVGIGPDLAECSIAAVDAGWLLWLLGQTRLRRILHRLLERVGDSEKRFEIRWLLLLVSKPLSLEETAKLLTPEAPPEVRRFAASHLLTSDYRSRAIAALSELCATEPSQAAPAVKALLHAKAELPRERRVLSDAAWIVKRREAPEAISTLLAARQLHAAVPAAIHYLTTATGPDQGFRVVVESLLEAEEHNLGLDAARWLALRPGYTLRLEACELLLEYGYPTEAVALLKYVACECHSDAGYRACKRLLMLNEADLAIPLLRIMREGKDADRRYESALALALFEEEARIRDSTRGGAAPCGRRTQLKTSILKERTAAFHKAKSRFRETALLALERLAVDSSAPLSALAHFSLGWLETPPVFAPWRDDAVNLGLVHFPGAGICAVFTDLSLGRIDDACSRLLQLLSVTGPGVSPLVEIEVLRTASRIAPPGAGTAVAQKLGSKDHAVHLESVRALPNLAGDSSIQILENVLQDKDRKRRSNAAWVLGDLQDPMAVRPLSASLHDSERYIRRIVVHALGKAGDLTARDHVRSALDDRDRDVRIAAVQALGKFKDAETVKFLVPALGDDDSRVREAVARALGTLGVREAIKPLLYVLSDCNSSVRIAAVRALEGLGFPDATEPLYSVLEDRDSGVRRAAVRCLGALAGANALERLRTMLEDPDPEVRAATARTLGDLGTEDIVAILEPVLEQEDSMVRLAAAEALGTLGFPETVLALRRGLADQDSSVRAAAVKALGALSFPKILVALQGALQDNDRLVRMAAVQALGALASSEAIATLLEVLRHHDRQLRQAAAKTLARLNNSAGTEVLVSAVGDHLPMARSSAVYWLGLLRDPSAVPCILSAATDDDDLVRFQAVTALGRFTASDEILWSVLAALGDSEVAVRTAAARSLGRLRDQRAIPALMARLGDLSADPEAAAEALARLEAHESISLLEANAMPSAKFVTAMIHLRPRSALTILNRFTRRLLRASWAHRLRGQAHWQQGEESDAYFQLRRAFDRDHGEINSLALGHFYLERGENPEAKRFVGLALRDNEDDALIALTWAATLWCSGEWREATSHLRRAQTLNPQVTDPQDLKFDHFWREKALAALDEMEGYAQYPVPASEVAEPETPYRVS
jgi:HEAT repeat protein